MMPAPPSCCPAVNRPVSFVRSGTQRARRLALLLTRVSGCYRHFPQRADWYGAQARSEGEGLLSGVHDNADNEVIAEPLCEVAQSAEVVLADGGRCLDFDAHYFALTVLEDHVDRS